MKNDRNWKQAGKIAFVAVSILLLLAFTAAVIPQMNVEAAKASPTPTPKCKVKHKVAAGESLTSIGNAYGVDWRVIAEANDLKEPYVLTIGQVLCIPGGTKPAPTAISTVQGTPAAGTSGTKGPAIGVAPGIFHIGIDVKGFSKKAPYFVNMAVYPKPVNQWRIGRMTTDKNGSFAGVFKMPADFPHHRYAQVCLKNAWTDATACVIYENPYYNFALYKISCPPRDIRR